MADPRDYLNLSEKREIAEIEADRAELRRRNHDLSVRRQRILNRARARLEAAAVATGARS